MPLVDILGQSKKHNAMGDTWGHVYPAPKTKHTGFIVFSYGCYGDRTILESSFDGLCSSPMRFHLEQDVFDMFEVETGGVYRVDCTLWFFKTVHGAYLGKPAGKIIKATCTTLFNFE
jgi:hypothetical protein